jgi:hypothetical protein
MFRGLRGCTIDRFRYFHTPRAFSWLFKIAHLTIYFCRLFYRQALLSTETCLRDGRNHDGAME